MKSRGSGIMRSPFVGGAALLLLAAAASANINLEWRPPLQSVPVGDPVAVGLYAVSDDDEQNQSLAAMDLIFEWDPVFIQLLGLDTTGATPLLFSGFPTVGTFGLNEPTGLTPYRPQDGDGLYRALANFGSPTQATPAGTLMTTFRFQSLAPISSTELRMSATGGAGGETIVFDGIIPNTDVTGTLGEATIEVTPEPTSAALLLLGCLLSRRRGRRALAECNSF